MLEDLKEKVYKANMDLPRYGLVTFTWGNVSGIDREKDMFVIKPSGIEYDKMSPSDMVVMDMNGNKVEGKLNPSSDVKTHLVLYKAFPDIGGIVHTHSTWATSWAQAGRDIPCYGTTHADYFYGSVPCTRSLTKEEIDEDYETNIGKVIADFFLTADEERKSRGGYKPEWLARPCVLCKHHGPFAWGNSPDQAVYHAVVLEEVAKIAAHTEAIQPNIAAAPQVILDKHYLRKHGPNAYYGQSEASH